MGLFNIFRGRKEGPTATPRRSSRSAAGCQVRASLSLPILAAALGCRPEPTVIRTQAEVTALVPGKYIGHYSAGTESFALTTDGTFTHTFVSGSKPNVDYWGHWSISPLGDKWRIKFEPFMDLSDAITGVGPPRQFGTGTFDFVPDGPTLMFSDDDHHYAVKVSEKPPSTKP